MFIEVAMQRTHVPTEVKPRFAVGAVGPRSLRYDLQLPPSAVLQCSANMLACASASVVYDAGQNQGQTDLVALPPVIPRLRYVLLR
jgi:hypothetical protein